ncbi:hypothetical protein [Nocardioides sp.]|uniref:hypothetical protein n=1 Tax=Nocardioides sp. TaxID=35761 RepID=UPI00260C1A69|nr:hypothetical protein [Nocardioides sp.]MCW2738931.1 hypothetical protein [Nocardioides sp.]
MTEIRTRWLITGAVGVALAALTGTLAAYAQTGGADTLRLVTFGVMSLPCWLGLASLLLTKDDRPEHHEDSVEMQWITQATSGAFLDLLLVLGIATAATAVLGTDPVPTVAFVVVAMADSAARYAILQRREG